jgi:hypothetical protein
VWFLYQRYSDPYEHAHRLYCTSLIYFTKSLPTINHNNHPLLRKRKRPLQLRQSIFIGILTANNRNSALRRVQLGWSCSYSTPARRILGGGNGHRVPPLAPNSHPELFQARLHHHQTHLRPFNTPLGTSDIRMQLTDFVKISSDRLLVVTNRGSLGTATTPPPHYPTARTLACPEEHK